MNGSTGSKRRRKINSTPYRLTPGDRQRTQEKLKIKATDLFSYGYGPATKASFVIIKEVGTVDEDEDFS
ncbi:hypothetical protein MMC29_006012 [Sticta canariensis]|nr:hypothetical protein [Sticta canariensis]